MGACPITHMSTKIYIDSNPKLINSIFYGR